MTLVKSQLPSLTVGKETLESLPVSVTDLSFLGRALGAQVDGALGRSFLRHFAMTLDYATNALRLRRPVGGTERALDEREIAFRWANAEDPLAVVPVFVNEKGPYDFALDTGASSAVISLEVAAEFGLATAKISQLTAGGGTGTVSRVQLSSLAVGSARQENFGGGCIGLFGAAQRGVGKQVAGHSGLRLSAVLPRNARLPDAEFGVRRQCPSACVDGGGT